MIARRWCELGAVLLGVGLASCCPDETATVAAWPSVVEPRGAACAPDATNAANAIGAAPVRTDGAAPSARTLLAAHAAEIERLPTLVSAGILEVRWRGDDRPHFEQGDLDLRFRAPDELSLRLHKLGETLFLGGCNAAQWWWYEGWSKPTTMSVGVRETGGSSAASDAGRRGPPIEAHELLTILGLRSLGSVDSDRAARPAADGGWIVDLEGATSLRALPARATFVPAQAPGAVGWSLRSLEVIDADGVAVLTAHYENHRRIERRGLPPGDWPIIATRVRITVPPRGKRNGLEWLVELDRPSATGERIVERLFDLEAVSASVRADRVERVDGGAP